jgi:hypothetical protein
MAAATGACYPRPAMTWAATPDPLPDPMPEPSPDQSPEISPTTSATTSATTSSTTGEVPAFGWSGYAERVNGRFAMVGFIAVLLIEALSGETFLRWAGLVP